MKDSFATEFNESSATINNLAELFTQHLAYESKSASQPFVDRCLQMYEVTQVKMGCIIMGDAQTAKTTLVETVAGGLNIASHNELRIRIAQVRKEKLKYALS